MPVALIPAGLQTAVGAFQTIFGGSQAHKAQKQMERMATPNYQKNQGINDYYQQALQRYNVSPYQSQQYNAAKNNAMNATASGLNALSDRKSSIAGIGRLAAIQNNAMQNAGVQAENERNQRFGQLGQATNMKANDDRFAYQQNQVAPYEKKMQLLGMKAGGGNQIMNAGLNNIFGGIQSGAMIGTDYMMNRPQKQAAQFSPYPVDYSLAPISGRPNTTVGAPPTTLNRNPSLQFGSGLPNIQNYGE